MNSIDIKGDVEMSSTNVLRLFIRYTLIVIFLFRMIYCYIIYNSYFGITNMLDAILVASIILTWCIRPIQENYDGVRFEFKDCGFNIYIGSKSIYFSYNKFVKISHSVKDGYLLIVGNSSSCSNILYNKYKVRINFVTKAYKDFIPLLCESVPSTNFYVVQ